MRTNTRKTLAAFYARKSLRLASSVWTNGDHIYSYGTCLAARLSDGRIVLNRTKYSPTTSNHQNAIAAALGPFISVDGLRFGADSRELIAAVGGAN